MKPNTGKWILIVLPLILTFLIMLPRLLYPSFGLLDDGTMFARAQETLSGDFSTPFDTGAGRFRPVTGIINAINYLIGKYNPFWHFINMALVFLAIQVLIVIVMKEIKIPIPGIILSIICFALGGTIVESFFTLSKHETIQTLWIMLSLLFLVLFSKHEKNKLRLFFLVLSGLFASLAFLTKETTFAMVLIAGGWWMLTLIKKSDFSTKFRKTTFIYLVIVGIGAILYFGFRKLTPTAEIASGTYSTNYSFAIRGILSNTFRWMHLLLHYFPYLIPVLFGGSIFLLGQWKKKLDSVDILMVFSAWWGICWFAIFIPWKYAESYYLLPFSLGAAVFVGLYIYKIFSTKVSADFLQKSLASITLLLFILTIPNFITNGKIQIAMDKVHQETLKYVSNTLEQNGRLLINIQKDNEYYQGVQYFLSDYYHRADVSLETVASVSVGNNDLQTLIIVPSVTNQPILTPRMNIIEESQTDWNQILYSNLGDGYSLKNVGEEQIHLFNINFSNILCPVLGERNYCVNHEPIVDTRVMTYRWDVIEKK